MLVPPPQDLQYVVYLKSVLTKLIAFPLKRMVLFLDNFIISVSHEYYSIPVCLLLYVNFHF